jgi:hypothetical protein
MSRPMETSVAIIAAAKMPQENIGMIHARHGMRSPRGTRV